MLLINKVPNIIYYTQRVHIEGGAGLIKLQVLATVTQ